MAEEYEKFKRMQDAVDFVESKSILGPGKATFETKDCQVLDVMRKKVDERIVEITGLQSGERIDVKGFGNCAFSALSLAVTGTVKHHDMFRQGAVGKMRLFPDAFNIRNLAPADFLDYVEDILNEGKPVCEDAIFAAADAFGIRIISFHSKTGTLMSQMVPRDGIYFHTVYIARLPSHIDMVDVK